MTKISKKFHSLARGWIIIAVFVAFVIYIAVTLPILQDAPGGNIESLDTKFFYKPEVAFSTVESYGDAKNFWIGMYLTWDVITPILYTLAFSLLISWLFQRSFKPESNIQKLNVVPVVGGLFDILENLSVVTLLGTYPSQITAVAWFSTFCTVSKMSFLGVSVLLILFGFVKAAVNRFKKQ